MKVNINYTIQPDAIQRRAIAHMLGHCGQSASAEEIRNLLEAKGKNVLELLEDPANEDCIRGAMAR